MNAKCVLLLIFIFNSIDSRFYNDDRDDYFSGRRAMLERDDDDDDLKQQLRSLFLNHQKRSWQAYVDNQLVGAGLKAGAIIGLDGGTWASSPGFGLKPGEGAAILSLFKSPIDVFAKGVTVNGVKYMGIKGDENSIYGKKGAGGVIIVKTGQMILIGVYYERTQAENAARIVEKLGHYLRENGY